MIADVVLAVRANADNEAPATAPRSTPGGNKGSVARLSRRMTPTVSTAAPSADARATAACGPWSITEDSPSTRSARAAVIPNAAGASRLPPVRRPGGSSHRDATSPATARGTLTQNTDRQRCERSLIAGRGRR